MKKEYETPILIEEEVEIDDVIAASFDSYRAGDNELIWDWKAAFKNKYK